MCRRRKTDLIVEGRIVLMLVVSDGRGDRDAGCGGQRRRVNLFILFALLLDVIEWRTRLLDERKCQIFAKVRVVSREVGGRRPPMKCLNSEEGRYSGFARSHCSKHVLARGV